MTPFEMTRSAQPSSTGKSSIRPSRNSTLSNPNLTAIDLLRFSISGVMSTPITFLRCPPIAPPGTNPYRLQSRDRQLSHQASGRSKRTDCLRRQRPRRHIREAGRAPWVDSRVGLRELARYGSDTQPKDPQRPRGISHALPCAAPQDRPPGVFRPSSSPSDCPPDDLPWPQASNCCVRPTRHQTRRRPTPAALRGEIG